MTWPPGALKVPVLVLSTIFGYALIGHLGPQYEVHPPPLAETVEVVDEPAPGDAEPEPQPAAAIDPALLQQGREVYRRTCIVCHGEHGEGNELLNSPRLAGHGAWYLERQLENFRSGARGTDPSDVFGMQMRPMALVLADGEAAAVSAYLSSLR